MVSGEFLIRKKWRHLRKFVKVLIIVLLFVVVMLGFFLWGKYSSESVEVVIDNPLTSIVFANTNSEGKVNKTAVIEQAVLEFDGYYINYILASLSVSNLHKSYIGYGNPIIEMEIGDEVWSTEIKKENLFTKKEGTLDEDLRIIMSKEEAVSAILSTDIDDYMKISVMNGRTEIEMVAGKVELGSKGYLAMYKEITGEELDDS